ncbi:prepilin peptidase [Roseomonas sp. GCM10028921]
MAALSLTLLVLLACAAWHDIATRRVPDALSVAVLVAALALRAAEGPSALIFSLGSALLLFLALFVFAMRGLLGGGDVKLAGALAVAFPPSATWDFIVATSVFGGILGLTYIGASRLLQPAPILAGAHGHIMRVLAIEGWRIRRRGPVPYAVAIALGGAFVLLGSPGL